MDKDFSSSTKRVLFHFPKTETKYDEWIEIGSSRISPFNTKQDFSKEKRAKKSGQANARTIGSAAKGKVLDTGTKKKVATNKVHPTEEVSSGKHQSPKASMEMAASGFRGKKQRLRASLSRSRRTMRQTVLKMARKQLRFL
jgi:hypothetical protein